MRSYLLVISSVFIFTLYANMAYSKEGQIIIKWQSSQEFDLSKYNIVLTSLDELFAVEKRRTYNFGKEEDGSYMLSIPSNQPLVLSQFSKLPFATPISCLLEPGDEIQIKNMGDSYEYSGKGSEVFELIDALNKFLKDQKRDSLIRMGSKKFTQLEKYYAYVEKYSAYQTAYLAFINSYKGKLSPGKYSYLYSTYLTENYFLLGQAFDNLIYGKSKLQISEAKIAALYKETIDRFDYFKKQPFEDNQITPSVWGLEIYARYAYWRSKDFQAINESYDSTWINIYYYSKTYFNGLAQRKLLAHIIKQRILKESPTPMNDDKFKAINDFLALSGYPEYDKIVSAAFLKKYGYPIDKIDASSFTDGPYALRKDNQLILKSIKVKNDQPAVKVDTLQSNAASRFMVRSSDGSAAFEVKLKAELKIEPCEYKQPARLLALSDIEGNFTALKELLQANKVIDEKYNWIFGSGHLVLVGDFVDRGNEVTEVLWLIYSLEEKAKAKNGYVHFILGNHEIMNLSGDDRYVHYKYKHNAQLLNENYSTGLYGVNSELGNWLRTKNIIEKIGDNLFCHGGISPQVNRMNISIEEINNKVRPYYDNSTLAATASDEDVKTLYNGRKSPFWYRFYYLKDYFSKSNNEMFFHASQQQIDSTCSKFDVRRIITGHTIIADTVSVQYEGKVINLDTHHAEGFSEALLIDKNECYSVGLKGKRRNLMNARKENAVNPKLVKN